MFSFEQRTCKEPEFNQRRPTFKYLTIAYQVELTKGKDICSFAGVFEAVHELFKIVFSKLKNVTSKCRFLKFL